MQNTPTALVVDDSLTIRLMAHAILEALRPGWNVHLAPDAEHALELATEHAVDLMLLDFNMPGMDGLELAEELLQKHPEARVALLTANVQNAIQERAEGLGVCFIPKPLTEDKIEEFLLHAEIGG